MMQYELHDTLLIIKSDERFETTIDAEFLSQVEIEGMLNFLVQNDGEADEEGNPIQVSNLTLPTYDLLPPDYDREITSFIQVRKDTNEIIILLQVDHSHYSTSLLHKFLFNEENKGTMVEMLNKLMDVAFPGTIVDIHEQFVIDAEHGDDTTSNSSESDSED